MAALNLLNHGFGHCSEEAFASFSTDLTQGAWASVARVRDDSPDRRPAGSLLREPFAVVWRAQLTWSVEDMAAALNAQSNNDALDIAWDRSQRRLDGQVTADENHDDPVRAAAAARIRKGFLVGRGTEQTTWTLDREVDLGRAQVKRAVSDEYKSDVALLGYGPIFAEVHKTTEALARSIGRGDEATKGTPRHARRRAAFGNCVTAFNMVFGQMGWMLEHLPPGEDRDLVASLHATLRALLDRHAPKASAGESEPVAKPATPVAPVTPAAPTDLGASAPAKSAPSTAPTARAPNKRSRNR